MNLPLHGGEEIRVPEASKIYVVGNVKKPGAFPVRDSADTSVLKVLALAEGLTPYSRRSWPTSTAAIPTAARKDEIEIELEKIMKRKTPDVPLDADDILYIPDNTGRRATLSRARKSSHVRQRRRSRRDLRRASAKQLTTPTCPKNVIITTLIPAVIPDALRVPYQAMPNGHPPGWDPEPEEPAVPLSHYLWILKRHRWKILAFVSACVIATLIVSLRLTPIYESTAVIDIDRRMPTGILGQEATQSATNDADQFLATQIKLIQADAVLRPVAQKYNLRELENDDWDARKIKEAGGGRYSRHPQKAESHAPAEHLHSADQLSIAATSAWPPTSPTGSRNRIWSTPTRFATAPRPGSRSSWRSSSKSCAPRWRRRAPPWRSSSAS